ncbi:ParB/RepB/Spo0J family partition protein [Parvularcula oceani]|uniref:ParB/RepB/Spo0J family partition protein n=1 Tax=Parvularcula oceani TaxID=1247963 RepID=UPI00068D5520|nr:ParB/RepB/Spo0J family partition protein [Parvularcula oceani]
MPPRKRSLALADAIAAQLEGGEAAPQPKKRAYAATREGLLQDLESGRLQNGKIRLVDPARCRMWARHNRIYDLLNAQNCASLIDSMKALGRQEMPAIVRPVANDPDHDFEVICGARRHFAVSHLRAEEHSDIRYLVDVRDMSDEEAFRVSDAENRDREDISDYERSADYARALTDFYGGNRKLMAERIGVDRTWLSRFVRIAELPDAVVSAYGDVRSLGIKHASELYPLLSEPAAKSRLIAEAERLAGEQEERRARGQAPLEPRAVLSRLKRAASGEGEASAARTRKDESGKVLFRVEDRARSVVVTIPRDRLAALELLMAELRDELGA